MIICQGSGDFTFLKNSLLHNEWGIGKQLSTRSIYQNYIDLDEIWDRMATFILEMSIVFI